MATAIASLILTRILGGFVREVDLAAKNLDFNVFKGSITLNNLNLNPNALSNLLPSSAPPSARDSLPSISGVIQKVHVEIPYLELKKKPVIVTLNGVFATITPPSHSSSQQNVTAPAKKDLNLKRDVLLRHQHATERHLVLEYAKRTAGTLDERSTRRLLSFADGIDQSDASNASEAKSDSGASSVTKEDSYTAKIIRHVLSKLIIRIENVHVRYESQFSAIGFTLASFDVKTSVPDKTKMVKEASLTCLSVYCDVDIDSSRLCSLPSTSVSFAKAMMDGIPRTAGSTQHQFLLHPCSIQHAVISWPTVEAWKKPEIRAEWKAECVGRISFDSVDVTVSNKQLSALLESLNAIGFSAVSVECSSINKVSDSAIEARYCGLFEAMLETKPSSELLAMEQSLSVSEICSYRAISFKNITDNPVRLKKCVERILSEMKSLKQTVTVNGAFSQLMVDALKPPSLSNSGFSRSGSSSDVDGEVLSDDLSDIPSIHDSEWGGAGSIPLANFSVDLPNISVSLMDSGSPLLRMTISGSSFDLGMDLSPRIMLKATIGVIYIADSCKNYCQAFPFVFGPESSDSLDPLISFYLDWDPKANTTIHAVLTPAVVVVSQETIANVCKFFTFRQGLSFGNITEKLKSWGALLISDQEDLLLQSVLISLQQGSFSPKETLKHLNISVTCKKLGIIVPTAVHNDYCSFSMSSFEMSSSSSSASDSSSTTESLHFKAAEFVLEHTSAGDDGVKKTNVVLEPVPLNVRLILRETSTSSIRLNAHLGTIKASIPISLITDILRAFDPVVSAVMALVSSSKVISDSKESYLAVSLIEAQSVKRRLSFKVDNCIIEGISLVVLPTFQGPPLGNLFVPLTTFSAELLSCDPKIRISSDGKILIRLSEQEINSQSTLQNGDVAIGPYKVTLNLCPQCTDVTIGFGECAVRLELCSLLNLVERVRTVVNLVREQLPRFVTDHAPSSADKPKKPVKVALSRSSIIAALLVDPMEANVSLCDISACVLLNSGDGAIPGFSELVLSLPVIGVCLNKHSLLNIKDLSVNVGSRCEASIQGFHIELDLLPSLFGFIHDILVLTLDESGSLEVQGDSLADDVYDDQAKLLSVPIEDYKVSLKNIELSSNDLRLVASIPSLCLNPQQSCTSFITITDLAIHSLTSGHDGSRKCILSPFNVGFGFSVETLPSVQAIRFCAKINTTALKLSLVPVVVCNITSFFEELISDVFWVKSLTPPPRLLASIDIDCSEVSIQPCSNLYIPFSEIFVPHPHIHVFDAPKKTDLEFSIGGIVVSNTVEGTEFSRIQHDLTPTQLSYSKSLIDSTETLEVHVGGVGFPVFHSGFVHQFAQWSFDTLRLIMSLPTPVHADEVLRFMDPSPPDVKLIVPDLSITLGHDVRHSFATIAIHGVDMKMEKGDLSLVVPKISFLEDQVSLPVALVDNFSVSVISSVVSVSVHSLDVNIDIELVLFFLKWFNPMIPFINSVRRNSPVSSVSQDKRSQNKLIPEMKVAVNTFLLGIHNSIRVNSLQSFLVDLRGTVLETSITKTSDSGVMGVPNVSLGFSGFSVIICSGANKSSLLDLASFSASVLLRREAVTISLPVIAISLNDVMIIQACSVFVGFLENFSVLKGSIEELTDSFDSIEESDVPPDGSVAVEANIQLIVPEIIITWENHLSLTVKKPSVSISKQQSSLQLEICIRDIKGNHIRSSDESVAVFGIDQMLDDGRGCVTLLFKEVCDTANSKHQTVIINAGRFWSTISFETFLSVYCAIMTIHDAVLTSLEDREEVVSNHACDDSGILNVVRPKLMRFPLCDVSAKIGGVQIAFNGFSASHSELSYSFEVSIPERVLFSLNVAAANRAKAKAALRQLVISCINEGNRDHVFDVLVDHFDFNGTVGEKWCLNGYLKTVDVKSRLSDLLVFVPQLQNVVQDLEVIMVSNQQLASRHFSHQPRRFNSRKYRIEAEHYQKTSSFTRISRIVREFFLRHSEEEKSIVSIDSVSASLLLPSSSDAAFLPDAPPALLLSLPSPTLMCSSKNAVCSTKIEINLRDGRGADGDLISLVKPFSVEARIPHMESPSLVGSFSIPDPVILGCSFTWIMSLFSLFGDAQQKPSTVAKHPVKKSTRGLRNKTPFEELSVEAIDHDIFVFKLPQMQPSKRVRLDKHRSTIHMVPNPESGLSKDGYSLVACFLSKERCVSVSLPVIVLNFLSITIEVWSGDDYACRASIPAKEYKDYSSVPYSSLIHARLWDKSNNGYSDTQDVVLADFKDDEQHLTFHCGGKIHDVTVLIRFFGTAKDSAIPNFRLSFGVPLRVQNTAPVPLEFMVSKSSEEEDWEPRTIVFDALQKNFVDYMLRIYVGCELRLRPLGSASWSKVEVFSPQQFVEKDKKKRMTIDMSPFVVAFSQAVSCVSEEPEPHYLTIICPLYMEDCSRHPLEIDIPSLSAPGSTIKLLESGTVYGDHVKSLRFRFGENGSWSEPRSLETPGNGRSPVCVPGPVGQGGSLVVTVRPHHKLESCRVVVVEPLYIIRNASSQTIEIDQPDSTGDRLLPCSIASGSSSGVYFADKIESLNVRVHLPGYEWSQPFSLETKGSFYLRLSPEGKVDGHSDTFLYLSRRSKRSSLKTVWIIHDDDGTAPYMLVNNTASPLQYHQQDSGDNVTATLNPGYQVHFAWKYPNGTKRLMIFDTPVCISESDQVTTFRHDGQFFSCEIQPRGSVKVVIISDCTPGQIAKMADLNVLEERRSPLCVRSMAIFARQKIDVEFVCHINSIKAEIELENKNKFSLSVDGSHGSPAIEAHAGFSCVSTSLSLRIDDVSLVHSVPGLVVPPLVCMWFDSKSRSEEAFLSGELEHCFLRLDTCLLRNTPVRDRFLIKSLRFSMHPIALNVHASILDSILSLAEKIPRLSSFSDEKRTKRKEVETLARMKRPKTEKPILIEDLVASPVLVHLRFISGSEGGGVNHMDIIQLVAKVIGAVGVVRGGTITLLQRTTSSHREFKDGLVAALGEWKKDSIRQIVKSSLSEIEGNTLVWYAARLASRFISDEDD